MDMNLMRDFEELEGMNQPEAENKKTDENQEEDDDDENFRPINCTTLSSADIYYELDKRGIKSTGFPDQDRDTLQKAFDEEFQADLEDARARRKEAKRRAQLQAGLQKRRMLMETTLQEEQDVLATNHQLSMMLEMVRENQVSASIRLDLDSVSARVLAKAMWANNTITCLDLSNNDLNDHAGSYIARILKRNNTVKKLELDSNNFGLRTCLAFGESLKENSSLVYLSLDSNPLVGENSEEQVHGIKALSDSLRVNKTLTSLNIWRTQIPCEGGEFLANAVEGNTTLLFCEVGHNRINICDSKRIANKMDINLAAFEAAERARRKDSELEEQRAQKDREVENQRLKDIELKEWLQKKREQRAENRRLDQETIVLDGIAEAEYKAKVLADERKAAAKAAAEAEEKKKAKAAKAKK